MPLCGKCGKNLVCDCGAPAKTGSTAQPCPLKKGAIWIHVRDDLGADIGGAVGKKGGDQKTSQKSDGLAVFDPLDPGKYDVDLGPLSTALSDLYTAPAPPTIQSVAVANGEIAYVAYTLVRKALLKVKVVLKDGSKTFDGATVSVTGPQAVPDKPTAAGVADFGRVESGKYSIKVTLKTDDQKDHATTLDFTKTVQEADLAPGQETEVKVEVEKKNVVTPKLELEYKLVLLDNKLHEKQSGETKIKSSPTYVQITLDQTNTGHPFDKGATLECAPANVEVFVDEACATKLTGALTNKQLTEKPPLKLYLRGVTAGKFKVKAKLEDTADRFVRLEKNPTDEQEMGVVKLELKLHRQDAAKLKDASMQVDPDTDPVDTYYTNLKDKALPDQKLMTDAEKIGKPSKDDAATPARLLHVQNGAHFGRAKLICAKLDAGHLPAGTDDYEIVLSVGRGWAPESGAGALKTEDLMGGGSDTPASGAIELYDKEFEGAKKNPVKIKVSELKAAEQTFYAQGTAETEDVCGVRLDIGLDRAAGGLDKGVKRNGDWVRFTIVKIKEVKVDYTPAAGKPVAWDTTNKRFRVNLKSDPDGRKVTITAELTKKLKNVNLYFMLAPHEDNRKLANWGIDMPGAWVWKDITKDIKHLDKADRKDFLHLSEKTVDGKASKELTLSRIGGDRFQPGVYTEEDAHLAKYVPAHADLKKKQPVLCADTITVWRAFWYQLIEVSGVASPGVAGAVGQYTLVRSSMEAATPKAVTLVDAKSWNAIYPRYMIAVGGGNADSLVISDTNKANFFAGITAETDKPIKIPILICDAQWDSGPDTTPVTTGYFAAVPQNITVDRLVLSPPLQGGDLFVAGRVQYRHPGATAGTWVNSAPVDLTAAEIDVDSGRGGLRDVRVSMPAAVTTHAATHAGTEVKIIGLKVKGAKGPYLGESSGGNVLAVYKPTQADDFQNTIAHEIGHGFDQTIEPAELNTQSAGIPDHPNQYISYDSDGVSTGSHCNKDTNTCVMFQSGPIAGSLNRYCDVCHPYLLVNDMSDFT